MENFAHIGFKYPPQTTGTDEEIMSVYRRVRDEIRTQLGDYFCNELAGS
ncbi:MAG TPA: hypothetical protein VKN62_08035 [Pelovirga sp.]|nr:hypothetical protein [Pelovirga sp.]